MDCAWSITTGAQSRKEWGNERERGPGREGKGGRKEDRIEKGWEKRGIRETGIWRRSDNHNICIAPFSTYLQSALRLGMGKTEEKRTREGVKGWEEEKTERKNTLSWAVPL